MRLYNGIALSSLSSVDASASTQLLGYNCIDLEMRVITKLPDANLIHYQVQSKSGKIDIAPPEQLVPQWPRLGTGISNEMVG